MRLHQAKKFFIAKEIINKIKRQPKEWENIFDDTSDKGLISKIYKELTKLNTQKTTKLKNGQRTCIDISLKRTYRCSIEKWKMLNVTNHWEMRIKTTVRYHFTPVRMASINKSTNKCWWGSGERWTISYCWWDCRLVQPLWKAVWRYLKKIKMNLPFDPVIPLLGIYPKNPNHKVKRT